MLLMRRTDSALVLPACAGMILAFIATIPDARGAPRIRGDDPLSTYRFIAAIVCSPHTRG